MTISKTLALAVALAAPGVITAGQAHAQVAGIATADPNRAVEGSRAWQAARTQIQTTYKTQLDQAAARERTLQTELQPLVTAYQSAARAPNATEASVRPAAQALQTRQQAAQQELGRLTLPAQRAQAYAVEQISARLPEAVQAAVRARNVQLLLRPDAALFAQPTADVTAAITTELDRLVPSVGITPPANWQPGQSQQQAAAPAAAGTRPAAPAPAPAATVPANQRRPQGR